MTTTLKALLSERHLQSHPDFTTEYNRYAKRIDPKLIGQGPTKAQYYKWLAGEIRGLPRGHHCRVLEAMFPGWTAEMLFQAHADQPRVPGRPGAREPEADAQFESFIGAEMAESGATLVYPVFELTAKSHTVLRDGNIPRQHIFGKPSSPFAAKHRIDVPVALAENDVKGMIYVLSVMQRYTSVQVAIENDCEMLANINRPFISFGLSSNDCTHMYLQQSNPLFTIKDDPNSKTYLELLELRDGTRYSSTDDTNIGIIARVKPLPDLHPDRYWIFCAGLGPRGTTGASWYLANYWNVLQQKVGSHEFIAVAKVRSFSETSTFLDRLIIEDEEDRREFA